MSNGMATTSPLGPLFNLQLGKDLKRAGMDLALRNAGADFSERACALIREVHSGQTILAETWRQTCVENGVSPHHPNAWGALTSTLKARGIIRDTGTYATAQSVRNHGHTYRLWRVTQKD
jgi:hypothetical protein